MAPSEAGTTGSAFKKDWTREELEAMGPRQLGRLKAQGVDVGDLLSRKRIKRDPRSQGGGKKADKGGGLGEVVEAEAEKEEDEAAMNA